MSARFLVPLLLLSIFVAAASASAVPGTVGAQEGEVAEPEFKRHVDLGVTIDGSGTRTGFRLLVTVENRGYAPAYDVEVDVKALWPNELNLMPGVGFTHLQEVPVGEFTLEPGNGMRKGVWKIPVMPVGDEYTAFFPTNRRFSQGGANSVEATVRSLGSFEDPKRDQNNRFEYWFGWGTGNIPFPLLPDYHVLASLGESSLEVTMGNGPNRYFGNACVDITLPAGVTAPRADEAVYSPSGHGMTYTHGGKCRASSPGTVSGAFHVGESVFGVDDYTLTLPISATGAAVAERQMRYRRGHGFPSHCDRIC